MSGRAAAYDADHGPYSKMYLPRVREDDPTLTKLEYRGRHFRDEDAVRLAAALGTNTNVTRLAFVEGRLTDEGFLPLCAVLEHHKGITAIDFSENVLTDRSVKGLLKCMRRMNHILVDVALSGNPDVTADLLRDVELSCVLNRQPEPLKLALVDLSDNLLTRLILTDPCTDKPYTAVSAQLLSDALKENNSLIVLDVSGTMVGDANATIVAEALVMNTTLAELRLGGSDITCEGALALAEVLRSNVSLTELDLQNNAISDVGATGLAECLKVNKTLSQLQLQLNNISDGVLSHVMHALMLNSQPPGLKSILADLHANSSRIHAVELGNYTLEEPTGLVANDVTCRVLLNALRGNTSVTKVDLCNNRIGDVGAEHLAMLLRGNSAIRILQVSGNRIGDPGASALREALGENYALKTLDIDGNNVSEDELRRLDFAVLLNEEPVALKRTAGPLAGDDPSLHVLDFSHTDNPVTVRTLSVLCTMLSTNSHLRELCLANQKGAVDALNLLTALLEDPSKCIALRILDLTNMGLGDEFVSSLLAPALRTNTGLTDLRLADNSITAVEPLVKVLGEDNYTLINIDLNGNDIPLGELRDIDLLTRLNAQPLHFKEAVVRLFANTPDLVELNLCEYEKVGANYRYRKQYTDESVSLLCEALQINTILTSLGLAHNRVTDEGARHLADVIVTNQTLTALDLTNNQITDEGFLRIAKALLSNTTVTLVACDKNDIHPDTRRKLLQSTQSNTIREETSYDKILRTTHPDEVEQKVDLQILEDALKDAGNTMTTKEALKMAALPTIAK